MLHLDCIAVVSRLQVSAILLFAGCAEFFYLSSRSPAGVIILCAWKMVEDLLTWMAPMMLATCAFGLALNLLACQSQAPVDESNASGGGAGGYSDDGSLSRWPYFTQLGLRDFQLDASVEGTFWAPFWGIFDMYYAPDDLMRLEHASIFTPLFTWVYLLIALVRSRAAHTVPTALPVHSVHH